MSLPRYQAYKATSAPWLPSVPEHWQMLRADAVLETRADQVPPDALSGTEVFHYSIPIVQETGDGQIEEGTEILSAKLIVSEPCVLISKLNPRKGTVCIATPKEMLTVSSGEFVSLIPRGPDLRYVYYVVQSTGYRERLESLVESATRSHARVLPEDVRKFQWAFPPHDEQVSIASFLDRETAKIDALVAEQERLMALLREKRQAVISRAVTKGLNPDAAMKASGVEWLGDVPVHWDACALTRIASRVVVGIAEAATHAYSDTGTVILRATNVRPGMLVGEYLIVDQDFAEERESKRLRAGDLVTVRTGNAGVTAIVPPELDGCHCFTMLITTLVPHQSSRFLCYWMNSLQAQTYFTLEGWGTAQVNISVPILKALPVPLPPESEQVEIADYLDGVLGEIDELRSATAEAISRLEERRAALISAAVTGQIDVRHLASEAAA